MKKFLIATGLFLSLCSYVQAAENGVRVPYSRAVPYSIRSRAPLGAATRFFGTCRIALLRADVFLHLYQLKQGAAGATRKSVTQSPYWLDIFTKEKKRFTKIQHIRVPSSQGDWAFGVRLMWLDTEQQKMPVLMLEILNEGDFYGPTGTFHLFVFSEGLDHKAATESFSPHGNHNETTNFDFDRLDERGFMVVTRIDQESGDQPSQTTTLRWDGKRFSPAQAQSK